MLLVDHEAGNPPEARFAPRPSAAGFCGLRTSLIERERPVLAAVIDAREFLAQSVLAPANGLFAHIYKDAVSAAAVDQRSLLLAISRRALGARCQMLLFWKG